MYVSINRPKIKKREENRVTSHLHMEPHRRQKKDQLKFHPDGIFSKRIFGNLYKCDCGELTEEGFCEKCETRVVMPDHMPDFYVELCCQVPVMFADWEGIRDLKWTGKKVDPDAKSGRGQWNRSVKISPEEAKNLMHYSSFLEMDESSKSGFVYHEWDPEDESLDLIDHDKILIGVDALRFGGVPEGWIREHVVDYLSIPHTIFRPMVINGSTPFVTPINNLYSTIIKKINNVINMGSIARGRPLYLISEYGMIVKLYEEILEKLFDELQNVEYSIIKSEIISHPISGAIRAVLINRHDMHEDVIILGDTLVETLYPYTYNKYKGDMIEINKEFVEKDRLLIVNRPPTINHESIMAMKPRVASLYPLFKTDGTNLGLLHNDKVAAEIRRKRIADGDEPKADERSQMNFGDIEKFGQGLTLDENGEPDGVDVMGLRCIGMNPIMMDCMNADTDGDCLLEIALYSEEALAQAQLMLPSKSYMNYANGTIRNSIIEDFIYAEMCKEGNVRPLEEGLKKYEKLRRPEYFAKNQELGKLVWEYEQLPTVYDIAKFITDGEESEALQSIFNFFGNRDDFYEMANREGNLYSEEESAKFIKSVMSANNDDISKAGYFYKLLMASADDFLIVEKHCGSQGIEVELDGLTNEYFQYHVKNMWVNELKGFFAGDLEELQQICRSKGLEKIHFRSPLTCHSFPHTWEQAKKVKLGCRGICKRCAGQLPGGTVNVGTFTTLMVTEHATQNALSSMNKGVKANVNDIIQLGYHGDFTWEAISSWVKENVQSLSSENPKVAARFYEIAFMSRIRFDEDGPYVSSLKGSINHSNNLFGAYIFTPNNKNFEAMIRKKSFYDTSLKLQIAMNDYGKN